MQSGSLSGHSFLSIFLLKFLALQSGLAQAYHANFYLLHFIQFDLHIFTGFIIHHPCIWFAFLRRSS